MPVSKIFKSFLFLSTVSILKTALVASDSFFTDLYVFRNTETQANAERLITGGAEDSEKTLMLTPAGLEKANQLARKIVANYDLDVIYSSDLARAWKVAEAVQEAFAGIGKTVEIIPNKQLREILHGRYELMHSSIRNAMSTELIEQILNEQFANKEGPTQDKLLLWKFHPITKRRALDDAQPIDVAEYIRSGQTEPETVYELYVRAIAEFIKIASENSGKTIGIATHGIILSALVDALDDNSSAFYFAPYWGSQINRRIDEKDMIIVAPPAKINNCDLLHFRYNSHTNELNYLGIVER
jgi:broad specificity phosphatase PhoE